MSDREPSAQLLHPNEARNVSKQRLQDTCARFQQDPNLCDRPYTVQSKVRLEDFRDFVAALEERPMVIAPKNFPGLFRLCDEFGFELLSERLSEFLRSRDRKLREIVSTLENRKLCQECAVVALERELTDRLASEAELSRLLALGLDRLEGFEVEIGHLGSEVERLKGVETAAKAEITALQRSLSPAQSIRIAPARTPRSGALRAPVGLSLVLRSALGASSSLFDFVGLEPGEVADLSPGFRGKVVIVGPVSGKTCLVNRIETGEFQTWTPPTISPKCLQITHHETDYAIWDTVGACSYRFMLPFWLRDADGVFLTFDITHRQPFRELPDFLTILANSCPHAPILLVGTKADLADERTISGEEARQFAEDSSLGYAEVSSKTGEGIDQALAQMHSMVLSRGVQERSPRPFPVLWRGSVDRFSAESFHRCCDGHERTLTLIRDMNGNVFGGFAAPSWESPFFSKMKPDRESKSFLFTLRNPYNLKPQKFNLIAGLESSVIKVSPNAMVWFGQDDLVVVDGCNVNSSHSRGLGSVYENGTGIDGRLVFTGSDTFIVREIEVFAVGLDFEWPDW
jgi:small GTP-binding protein